MTLAMWRKREYIYIFCPRLQLLEAVTNTLNKLTTFPKAIAIAIDPIILLRACCTYASGASSGQVHCHLAAGTHCSRRDSAPKPGWTAGQQQVAGSLSLR